jgi:hypothetical protein
MYTSVELNHPVQWGIFFPIQNLYKVTE